MYEYVFENQLKINSNQHPVMLTELGLTSAKHREKLTEVNFDFLFTIKDQSYGH